MTATFPDVDYEVVRDSVIARSDDPSEPDQILGCTVVGTCLIHGRTARSVVTIDRPLELELCNDESIINIARPGLLQAFRELTIEA